MTWRRSLCHTGPTALGPAFHLINPVGLSLRDLGAHLRSAGYTVQPTTFAVWRDALVADHSPDNALYPMLPLLLTGDIEEQLLLAPEIFEIEHTRAGLAGTGITCPPLDGALLDVYLAAMVRSGFLPSPATRAAANVDVEEDGTAPNELVHASAALVRAERNDATCPTTLTTRARRNGNTGGSRHDATPGGSR